MASLADLRDSEFLGACLPILEQDSSVVLVSPKAKIINSGGRVLRNYPYSLHTDSYPAAERHDRRSVRTLPSKLSGQRRFLCRLIGVGPLPPLNGRTHSKSVA